MNDAIKTRKLNLVELVRFSSSVYKKNFKLILFAGLFLYVPYNIVMSMLPAISQSDLESLYQTGRLSMDWRYLAVMSVMSVCILPLVTSGATAVAKCAVENTELRPENILDATLGCWWKIILTSVMYSLLVGFGLMLIIPGLYFGLVMMFHTSVVALTGKTGITALRESMQVVRGRILYTLRFGVNIWIFNGLANLALLNLFTLAFGIIIIPLGGHVMIATTIGAVVANIICIYFRVMSGVLFLNLYYTKVPVGGGKSA